jgi:hypothetical protein
MCSFSRLKVTGKQSRSSILLHFFWSTIARLIWNFTSFSRSLTARWKSLLSYLIRQKFFKNSISCSLMYSNRLRGINRKLFILWKIISDVCSQHLRRLEPVQLFAVLPSIPNSPISKIRKEATRLDLTKGKSALRLHSKKCNIIPPFEMSNPWSQVSHCKFINPDVFLD